MKHTLQVTFKKRCHTVVLDERRRRETCTDYTYKTSYLFVLWIFFKNM